MIPGQNSRISWTCSQRSYSTNNDCPFKRRTNQKGLVFPAYWL